MELAEALKRIEELEQELRKIEDELQLHDNKTLMDSLSDHSMMILKNTFHRPIMLTYLTPKTLIYWKKYRRFTT